MPNIVPTIETTDEFILIKIPRNIFSGPPTRKRLSALERGLQESIKEARAGKLYGPFKDAQSFLRALKRPTK